MASQIAQCANYLGGEWIESVSAQVTPVYNPSRGEEIAHVPSSNNEEVDRAVQAAANALPGWSETPATERAQVLFRYKYLLEENFERLARSVTREHGKTIDEARGDVRRGIEVVDFACSVPSLLMGSQLRNVARGIDGSYERSPVGVCVGITPFNFPAMVPMWMYPLAIACGNTFILKPSPKVPLTPQLLVELAIEAGLPGGVLNLLHGGREVVDALLRHPTVAAISFVGSTPVARYVYEVGTANGKRVQSAGGAKNYMVVMPDADMTKTARSVMTSAFGCSGQRCMAGSVAVTVGAAAEPLLGGLDQAISQLRIGPTDTDDTVSMGPVIDPTARERVLGYLDTGIQEGALLRVDGRKNAPSGGAQGFFVGPSVFDRVEPGMHIAKEEIFGPVLSVMRTSTLEEAISLSNRSPYGNGAVIFTGDGAAARRFAGEVRCGMIGINVGVPAPMALFPFSGWNESFFGDLHVQGTEGIQFYTRSKVILSHWSST